MACVALQAQYILDTFGKFPGTVPTLFILNYVQAHHLDLEFYDHFFQPGAYLRTHADHMQRWHCLGGDRRWAPRSRRRPGHLDGAGRCRARRPADRRAPATPSRCGSTSSTGSPTATA